MIRNAIQVFAMAVVAAARTVPRTATCAAMMASAWHVQGIIISRVTTFRWYLVGRILAAMPGSSVLRLVAVCAIGTRNAILSLAKGGIAAAPRIMIARNATQAGGALRAITQQN